MSASDLNSGPAKLKNAWEKLRLRWEEARLHWRDEVSREFEENYLLRVEPQVTATRQRMHSSAATIAAARQELDSYR